MTDRTVLDAIKAELPLPDLAAELFPDRTKGRSFRCLWHDDRKPSAHLWAESGFCFVCQRPFDVFDLFMEAFHCSFVEAVQRLAERCGIEVPTRARERAERARKKRDALTAFAFQCHRWLLELPEAEEARRWIFERGIDFDTLRHATVVGFLPDEKTLTAWATQASFDLTVLNPPNAKSTAWRRNWCGKALTFAYEARAGEVTRIKLRKVRGSANDALWLGEKDDRPIAFGLRFAPPDATEVGIVEGEFDALCLWALYRREQRRIIPIVALGGGQAASNAAALKRFARIFVLPDNDDGGIEFAKAVAFALPDKTVLWWELPKGADPADYAAHGGVLDDLQTTFFDAAPVWEAAGRKIAASLDLSTPRAQAEAVGRVRKVCHELAMKIADPLARSSAVASFARGLESREDAALAGLTASAIIAAAQGESGNIAPIVTIGDVVDAFRKWLFITDEFAQTIEVVLATVIAHQISGDPLWLILIAPPASGKTELMNALDAIGEIVSIDSFTPAALLSGERRSREDEDPSLLPRLDGKIVLMKDFSTITEMPSETRSQVLTFLRRAYDGELARHVGVNVGKRGRLEAHPRFTIIAAATPVVDQASSVWASLGERFLRWRVTHGERRELATRALDELTEKERMRQELRDAVKVFVSQFGKAGALPLEPDARELILTAADFCAVARTPVLRDWRNPDEIIMLPHPETPARLVQQLAKLAIGLAHVRGKAIVTRDEAMVAVKAAMATVPETVMKTLLTLWSLRNEGFGTHSTSCVQANVKLTPTTTRRLLENLHALELVELLPQEQGQANLWRLSQQVIRWFEALDVRELQEVRCHKKRGCGTVPMTDEAEIF